MQPCGNKHQKKQYSWHYTKERIVSFEKEFVC